MEFNGKGENIRNAKLKTISLPYKNIIFVTYNTCHLMGTPIHKRQVEFGEGLRLK
jgi:hypothetical protein